MCQNATRVSANASPDSDSQDLEAECIVALLVREIRLCKKRFLTAFDNQNLDIFCFSRIYHSIYMISDVSVCESDNVSVCESDNVSVCQSDNVSN